MVAPLSGHHATLLRDTVSTLLKGHKVYITDWIDARMVPEADGAFTLDDYVTTMQRFMRETRIALHEQVPRPPHGSYLIEANFPRGLLYAHGGDHAVQVWFRDSTLHVAHAPRPRPKPALPAAPLIR